MKSLGKILLMTAAVALCAGSIVRAQDAQEKPTLNKEKQQTQQQSGTTLSLDTPATTPALSEEDTAMKALGAMPEASVANLQLKLQAAEGILQKYPQTRYRSALYAFLMVGYIQVGQGDKGIEFGDKEVELNPNDAQTMAIISQTIPRSFNPSAPDAVKKLDKAEQYGKKAVEILPTMPKPEGMTDDVFAGAKNQTLAIAHSGLGLVNWRRGKYADAIPELEQSIKLDPSPDPVNWYILGIADQNTSHFDDAAAAFGKCALIPGKLQDTCKTRSEEAKKLAATKLSVPK